MKKIIWIIGLIILFSGCSSDDDSPKTKQYKDIVGIWVPGPVNSTYKFENSVMEFRNDRTARRCIIENHDGKTDTYTFSSIMEYHDITLTAVDDPVYTILYTLECKYYVERDGKQLEFSEKFKLFQIENESFVMFYYVGNYFSFMRVPSINVAN